MSYNFQQWWRIIRITDHEGNDKAKFPFLLNDNCYAYGLHLQHYNTKHNIFCWELVEVQEDYCDWDSFSTSEVKNIKETEQQIVVTTKNSVYYFEKVETPNLPESQPNQPNAIKNDAEESVYVVPSQYGKLLILRANQQKYNQFNSVSDIRSSLDRDRRYTIRTDFSIVDFIDDSANSDACIQKISAWLTSRVAALREDDGKLPETELYQTFFNYTLHMLSKGDVLSYGIDDVIKMATVLQESTSLYVNTFMLSMTNTKHNDMILDVQDWLCSDPTIPRDFERYVLAAVATFVGSLPDPISSQKNK